MPKGLIEKSYEAHKNTLRLHASGEKREHAQTWFEDDTVDWWRHRRLYGAVDPIIEAYKNARWLTVGDGRYGNDAHYIFTKGAQALASDIDDVLLREAQEKGFIGEYRRENVEALSFRDEEFDLTLCKESYHHFPRPAIALYEMLRVSRIGTVLIEPNDIHDHPKPLIKLFDRLRGKEKQWCFEEVGNYVYTPSRREITKMALGIGLPSVAFKLMNDYHEPGIETEKAEPNNKRFSIVRSRIMLYDFLCKLRLMDYGVLVCALFKIPLEYGTKRNLKQSGFEVIDLPLSPLLKERETWKIDGDV